MDHRQDPIHDIFEMVQSVPTLVIHSEEAQWVALPGPVECRSE